MTIFNQTNRIRDLLLPTTLEILETNQFTTRHTMSKLYLPDPGTRDLTLYNHTLKHVIASYRPD